MLITIGLLVSAWAGEPRTQLLAKVASSYPKGYEGEISVVLEEDADRIAAFHYADNEKTDRDYTLEELSEGAVLVGFAGSEVVWVQIRDFEPETGGRVIIRFKRKFIGQGDPREVHARCVVSEGGGFALETDDEAEDSRFDGIAISIKKSAGIPSSISRFKAFLGGEMVRDYDPRELPKPTEDLLLPGF